MRAYLDQGIWRGAKLSKVSSLFRCKSVGVSSTCPCKWILSFWRLKLLISIWPCGRSSAEAQGLGRGWRKCQPSRSKRIRRQGWICPPGPRSLSSWSRQTYSRTAALTGDVFQLPTVKTTVKTIRLKRVTYSDFRPRNLSTLFLFLRHFSGPAAAGLFGTLTTDETVGHVPGSLQQPQNPFHHVPHPHRHPGDRFCSDRSAGCFLKVVHSTFTNHYVLKLVFI